MPAKTIEHEERTNGQQALVLEPKPDALMAVIERAAMSPEFDVEKLKQLLEMKERHERNEARKAFVSAMNAFKSDPPVITKNKTVSFGNGPNATAYKHPSLDHVCDSVTKALSQHGISHRWNVEQADQSIKVTCILTHELGHSEETTLKGMPDNSGSKNSIQAIGSTVTYLQRYTLLAACGLAAEDDNDGGSVNNGWLAEKLEWIENCRTVEELNRVFNAAYKEAKDANAKEARLTLIDARDKKRKELQ